ncbi:Hypothetical protein CINCED_3A019089 [Cinara cedri]|uniref:Uncharacterized protein n=1 Tax=Cinara cedri TaxID=506608 RepID=A0A5E4NMH1_9HEMI|nr:Hypothetical protein CINCED_3A019089 [Cinara cedri]
MYRVTTKFVENFSRGSNTEYTGTNITARHCFMPVFVDAYTSDIEPHFVALPVVRKVILGHVAHHRAGNNHHRVLPANFNGTNDWTRPEEYRFDEGNEEHAWPC